MLKCKHCKGTEFGLTVVETKVSGYKAINGEVVSQIGEPQVKTETKVTYCFGCNKEIVEGVDTYENETCTVCGIESEEVKDGKCPECDSKVKALARMTKEELIIMMMKNSIPSMGVAAQPQVQAQEQVQQPSAPVEEVTTVIEEQSVPNTTVEGNVNTVYNDAIIVSENEVDVNLQINEEIDSSDLNFESINDDIEFPVGDSDDDILAQLDSAVPINSLEVLSENITESI